MKSHGVVAQVGYWEGADPLPGLPFVVAAPLSGGAVGRCWTFVGVPVWSEVSPSRPLVCGRGETQILSQGSGQKSRDE